MSEEDFQNKNVALVAGIIFAVVLFVGLWGIIFNIE